jgi:hypothetical protein
MKLKLLSDFRDYYDHVFFPDGDMIVHRMAHDRAMPKWRQFDILQRSGIATPPVYTVGSSQADKLYGPADNVVVYTDEHLHCGGGKTMTSYDAAVKRFPPCQHACVPWYNSTGSYSESRSYRYLKIGGMAFWLRYEGRGGWMSNHAEETEIYLNGWCEQIESYVLSSYPMCAIDFVIPVDRHDPDDFADVLDQGIAIDFNTAPGLRHTGIEDVLSAIDIYNLLLEVC